MPTRAPSLPYHDSLDGLRGFGISAMLLYHLGSGWFSGAFLSLSMFFTLSGFLIASQLLSEKQRTGRISLPGFWERRLRRLLPASTLGLIGASAYTWFLAREDLVHRFGGDILAAVLYVPNWRFVVTGQSYEALFTDPTPVQHFWSLGIEEQFYLLFPVLVAGLLLRGSRRSLAFVIGGLALASSVAMMLLRTPGTPLGHAYYGTDARASEVLIGVLLAIWMIERPAEGEGSANKRRAIVGVLGALALLASFTLWLTTHETQLWFYRGGALGYSLLTAAVIRAAVEPGLVRTVLSARPAVYLGRISYGLYVYHWPIYLSLDPLAGVLGPSGLVAAKLIATGAVSVISLRWIEEPIRRRRVLLGARRGLAPVAAMGLVAALAASLMISHAGRESSISQDLADPVGGDGAESPSEPQRRLVVVGNSVAKNLVAGLRRWGGQNNVVVFDRAMNGCGLAEGGQFKSRNGIEEEGPDHECVSWRASWPDQITKLDPEIVVVLGGAGDFATRRLQEEDAFMLAGTPAHDDWLTSQYLARIDVLSANGAKVVMLTQPCKLKRSWLPRWIRTPVLDPALVTHFNEDLLPLILASRPDTTASVDLFTHVCPDGQFTHQLGEIENARADGVHFKFKESVWVGKRLGPDILEAVDRS